MIRRKFLSSIISNIQFIKCSYFCVAGSESMKRHKNRFFFYFACYFLVLIILKSIRCNQAKVEFHHKNRSRLPAVVYKAYGFTNSIYFIDNRIRDWWETINFLSPLSNAQNRKAATETIRLGQRCRADGKEQDRKEKN